MKKFIMIALLGSAMVMATDYTTYSAEELPQCEVPFRQKIKPNFKLLFRQHWPICQPKNDKLLCLKKGTKPNRPFVAVHKHAPALLWMPLVEAAVTVAAEKETAKAEEGMAALDNRYFSSLP